MRVRVRVCVRRGRRRPRCDRGRPLGRATLATPRLPVPPRSAARLSDAGGEGQSRRVPGLERADTRDVPRPAEGARPTSEAACGGASPPPGSTDCPRLVFLVLLWPSLASQLAQRRRHQEQALGNGRRVARHPPTAWGTAASTQAAPAFRETGQPVCECRSVGHGAFSKMTDSEGSWDTHTGSEARLRGWSAPRHGPPACPWASCRPVWAPFPSL